MALSSEHVIYIVVIGGISLTLMYVCWLVRQWCVVVVDRSSPVLNKNEDNKKVEKRSFWTMYKVRKGAFHAFLISFNSNTKTHTHPAGGPTMHNGQMFDGKKFAEVAALFCSPPDPNALVTSDVTKGKYGQQVYIFSITRRHRGGASVWCRCFQL